MITVTEVISDLERKVWKFGIAQDGVDRVVIRLNYYTHETRKTKRHKYSSIVFYSWMRRRESTIDRDDVPLPDHVVEEARRQLVVEVTK